MQLLSAYCPCQTLQTEAARWRLRPGRKISGCRRRRRVGRSLRVRYLRARLTPTWPVGSTRSSSISAWLDSKTRSARRSYFCDGEYQRCIAPREVVANASQAGRDTKVAEAARIAEAWDGSTAPCATSRSTISSASIRLQRLRLACRSGAQLIPILATRYGWARPGHACLWTDILNPL